MSAIVFVGQDLLTITLQTGYDLSQASSMEVHYLKPDGTYGAWTSNISYSGTDMIYDVQSGDIDQSGTWYFQPYIVVSGQVTWGVKSKHKFINPLS
jgi:hypothetical protein